MIKFDKNYRLQLTRVCFLGQFDSFRNFFKLNSELRIFTASGLLSVKGTLEFEY
jgi:hypothetical protein